MQLIRKNHYHDHGIDDRPAACMCVMRQSLQAFPWKPDKNMEAIMPFWAYFTTKGHLPWSI